MIDEFLKLLFRFPFSVEIIPAVESDIWHQKCKINVFSVKESIKPPADSESDSSHTYQKFKRNVKYFTSYFLCN